MGTNLRTKLPMKNEKNKLKVAFVLDTTLDVEDGVQQYILVLGDWLKERGHEVHYIVGETKRTDIENMHSLTKNFTVRFNGNKVIYPLPTGNKKIKEILNKEKFDVLHVQVPYSPFYGAKFVKYASKNTAIIGTFHILPFGKIAYAGTWILGLILRKNLKKFDQQISISPANQTFSARTFRTKSIVLSNMVKTREFNPNTSFKRNNKPVEILYLGRLTERKGCRYLLNALGKVQDNYPDIDFKLKIAGKGELFEKLQKQVFELQLEHKVEFLGYVTNENRVKLMQNADISVFPSYSGECFGIVLIEAMAAKSGLVLGGKNPGYETVLGGVEGSLVNVKDTDAFASLLYKYISDKKYREKVFDEQQKLIHQYDYNVVGQKILNVYHDCKKERNKT